MGNVLSGEKREQVLALGRLGWPLRRIEEATGVRRETAGDYLRKAGIVIRPRRQLGREVAVKSGHSVITGSGETSEEKAKPATQVTTGFSRGKVAAIREVGQRQCDVSRVDRSQSSAVAETRWASGRIWWTPRILRRVPERPGDSCAVLRGSTLVRSTGDNRNSSPAKSARSTTAPVRWCVIRIDGQVPAHAAVRDDARLQPQVGSPAGVPIERAHLGRAA